MKLVLLFILLLSIPWSAARADIKWLSRANCLGLINESVTYDRPQLNPHWMDVQSHHIGFGATTGHVRFGPLAYTWRSYAGDIGDVTRNTVTGIHYFVDYNNIPWSLRTIATNCNLVEW
jgi:hypothetical protein